jgi:SAM-dependent methyltransferase
MLNPAMHSLKRSLKWLLPSKIDTQRYRTTINPVFSYSKSDRRWETTLDLGIGGWYKVSNLSGGYHGLLRQWWDYYGLGEKVLLVSETVVVRKEFETMYKGKEFVATDYFTEISHDNNPPDVLWNVYEEPPARLKPGSFSSIICQATLEHIHDPIGVLRRLVALLGPTGYLYIHTHTPGFQYHPFPRDYLRFYPDWFQDMSLTIPVAEVVEIHCAGGYAFCLLRKK